MLKRWCIRTLRRVLRWLEPADAFSKRTDELVRLADTQSGGDASGEYKRHIVYARLIKDFPTARRCDLALAIEQAIQRIR